MKKISKFIEGIEFDMIESYRINRGVNIKCLLKDNSYTIIGQYDEELPNSIQDQENKLNKSAEFVVSISDKNTLDKFQSIFISKTNSEIYFSHDSPLFKDAILFYKEGKVIDGLNISFKQNIFQNLKGERLVFTKYEYEELKAYFYSKLNHSLLGWADYFGNISDKWREHRFPNSYYYNYSSKSYETTLANPILSLNTNYAHAIIETDGGAISQNQIKRLEYISHFPKRKKIFDMIFNLYNRMKVDYDLPDIIRDEDEILPNFVSLNVINIPLDDSDDILLSFKNWDEEHGLHIYINEVDQKIEFAPY
ncbi:beta clamp domain-containing protein [Flammeovirga kamogawensis]|uniref:Uncharacterized protein n=1 Tax=Flammeovirga kamogawensis TaxID=373891 RepID=A0ABX8H3B6_9BACT|nr:hypothetical protein [Flammeovirga kamogawensis]MBB6464107.1 hypothetical protein [Flammeovirga kamogawensis]QWG09906.1 hypothetical protein KM029_19690 [Flammeovirga kamogawensis]TRX65410.1 hypothetical protein EO216_23085 [Flammeovirga kamogawensis]